MDCIYTPLILSFRACSVEFWSGLSAFLDTQFQAVQSEGSPGERAAGEAEMERLFEDL